MLPLHGNENVSPLHSGEPGNKGWDSILVNMFAETGNL